MLRQFFAALATLAFVVAGPAVIAPQAPQALSIGAAEAKKADSAKKKDADEDEDEDKGAKKRRIPHNKKVGLNEDTLVFHDKTCRHFSKKLVVVSAKEAKAKGGKPCKVCLK